MNFNEYLTNFIISDSLTTNIVIIVPTVKINVGTEIIKTNLNPERMYYIV